MVAEIEQKQVSINAPRVYSYTRFSTPEQAGGDSQRRQAEGAHRWMVNKNSERLKEGLQPLVFDERLSLTDLGVSAYRGANTNKEGGLGVFLQACREALVPDGSYLVVESLDRISRMTPRRVSRLLDDIVDAGVIIATLSDGQEFDRERLDNDPTALLIALMVSWRAHEESKVKGQRLSAAWEEKRQRVRKGQDTKLTAKGPSWLQWENEKWIERSPHADTVRRIFKMALAGVGEHKTAQTFNLEEVPVMGRGKMWHRSTVSKVLRSPSVVGDLVPGRMDYSNNKRVRVLEEPIKGVFPAVVSEADWFAVRALKDGKAPATRGRGANAKVVNLFAGLAECPECGSRMTRVMKGTTRKPGNPKLVCTAAKAGAAAHAYRSISLEGLEDVFLDKWQSLLAAVPVGDAGGQLDAECANLEAAISVGEDELKALHETQERRPTTAIAARMRATDAALNSYKADFVALDQQRSMADHGLAMVRAEALADVLRDEEGEAVPDPNKAHLNTVLRSTFEGVVIDYVMGLLRFRWRQGGETSIRFAWVD